MTDNQYVREKYILERIPKKRKSKKTRRVCSLSAEFTEEQYDIVLLFCNLANISRSRFVHAVVIDFLKNAEDFIVKAESKFNVNVKEELEKIDD